MLAMGKKKQTCTCDREQRPERASWLDAAPPAVVLQPDDDDQPPADEQPQADEHLEANEEPETDEQEARFDNADEQDEESETIPLFKIDTLYFGHVVINGISCTTNENTNFIGYT